MGEDDDLEKLNVDPIWSTWKYGHDTAFDVAALMAEKMADGIESDPSPQLTDPARALRAMAGIFRMGKYKENERPHAMVPIDEALRHALDDPRVLGALADEIAAATFFDDLPPLSQAATIMGWLKEILLPPAEPE